MNAYEWIILAKEQSGHSSAYLNILAKLQILGISL